MQIEYAQADADARRANALRLREVAARIVASVPGATLARDSAGPRDRHRDRPLPSSRTSSSRRSTRVVALMRDAGMNATVSSIHVNGWFGDHDKPSGARWMVRAAVPAASSTTRRDRWVYVGDSTNDQAMFAQLPLSVGVANLLDFADRLTVWPRYITEGERGSGFAELARRVRAGGAVTRRAMSQRGPMSSEPALTRARDAARLRSDSRSPRRSRSDWRASPTRCCCRRCATTSAGATSLAGAMNTVNAAGYLVGALLAPRVLARVDARAPAARRRLRRPRCCLPATAWSQSDARAARAAPR